MFVILALICATLAAVAFGHARAALVLAFVVAGCGSPDQVPSEPTPEPTPEPGPARSSAGADASLRTHPPDYADKHLVFEDELDGGFAPVNHTELLWGDYIDRQGKPAVGWHSHDPATGNAM